MDRDTDLTTLLHDAVADVEPADRLAEIRQATESTPRRFGWYAAGGTALAVAASVTAFSLITSQSTPQAQGPGPLSSPTVAEPSATPSAHTVAAYYVGETPLGPRLYREFHVDTGFAELSEGISALMSGPDDPDYRSLWPAGSLAGAEFRYDNGDGPTQIDVTLADAALRDRPSDVSEAEARLAIEQVIYTVQAFAGRRLPVQFRFGDNPIDQVFGQPTSEALSNAPQLDVLSLMSISDPAEGLVVSDSFIARGAASSFEGNVPWKLEAPDGTVVREGFATAGMETHLVEWETETIDVSDLPPGAYTFVARTEGMKPFTDTRTVVVE